MDGTMTAPADPGAYAGMSETDLLAKLSKWDSALDAHWSDWRKEALEGYDLYAGRQWTKAEEEALNEAKRVPVTMNRIAIMIDAVSGAEIMGRQEAAYYPREPGDSTVNEILTKGAEWVRDQTDADFEESEAIRDTFICGMGWTETRMDYEEEVEGRILIERIDPLEMAADPAHRKAGCADSRFLRRKKPLSLEDFERLWPGKTATSDLDTMRARSSGSRDRYRADDGESAPSDDEVTVCEWQWYDIEARYLVADAQAEGGYRVVTADEAEVLRAGGVKVVKVTGRRYWRAFTAAEQVLECAELPDGEFTYKCMTGKRDRNKRVWFGLVRPMRDPQRWANSFFSQILHIINTTSKGGVMAEADVVEDVRAFEETLAKHDRVTWVPPGSLSMGKIVPKPQTAYPTGLDRLMEVSVSAIRDVTGVNQEMLGLADRQQAGVLEDQRKQAAYGVLAPFFDSVRRYRKAQGRLMLKAMRYLPEGTLVRIIGDDGVARYVPLAMQQDTAKFDVIVDEAQAGPQQKEKVWRTAMQMTPILQQLGPEEWIALLDYAPFPASIVAKLKAAEQKKLDEANKPPEQDPAAEAMKGAAVAEAQGKARLTAAKADKTEAEAGEIAQRTMAERMVGMTQAFTGMPLEGGPTSF